MLPAQQGSVPSNSPLIKGDEPMARGLFGGVGCDSYLVNGCGGEAAGGRQ